MTAKRREVRVIAALGYVSEFTDIDGKTYHVDGPDPQRRQAQLDYADRLRSEAVAKVKRRRAFRGMA